jgi:hypothetical protein
VELQTDEQYVKSFGTPSPPRDIFAHLHDEDGHFEMNLNAEEHTEEMEQLLNVAEMDNDVVCQELITRKTLRILENQDILSSIHSQQEQYIQPPALDLGTESILGLLAIVQESARLNNAQSELVYSFLRSAFRCSNGNLLPPRNQYENFCASHALRYPLFFFHQNCCAVEPFMLFTNSICFFFFPFPDF